MRFNYYQEISSSILNFLSTKIILIDVLNAFNCSIFSILLEKGVDRNYIIIIMNSIYKVHKKAETTANFNKSIIVYHYLYFKFITLTK